MAKQKKPRHKTYNASKHAVRAPKLLNKLPMPVAAVKNLRRAHQEKLMRLYFQTATTQDVLNLFTFFCMSQQLAQNMESEEALYGLFEKGKSILEDCFKQNSIERAVVDGLSDIIDIGITVWEKSSVEEILRTEKEIRANQKLLDIERLFEKEEVSPEEIGTKQ